MIRISTLIPTFNQANYIDAALHSAVSQVGTFWHEVLVSSDGSTDGTRDRIRDWQRRYPLLIKDISPDKNLGISGNFRRLFQAASGDYLAILEGDDLWTDPEKLQKQSGFLRENPECSMVFSKVLVRQLPSGKEVFLDRQTRLTTDKLTGKDFLADPSLNLIANFSTCMIKAALAKQFPDLLFTERFNEIAMAFHLEQFGPIGFLNEVHSIYHQHANGVWTGATPRDQLASAIKARNVALRVADARYHPALLGIIDAKQAELAKLNA